MYIVDIITDEAPYLYKVKAKTDEEALEKAEIIYSNMPLAKRSKCTYAHLVKLASKDTEPLTPDGMGGFEGTITDWDLLAPKNQKKKGKAKK